TGTNVSLTENANDITITNTYTYSPQQQDLTCVRADYTCTDSDYLIPVDCSGGAVLITLPSSPYSKMEIIVKDRTGSAAANNITVNGNGLQIDGSSVYKLNENDEST